MTPAKHGELPGESRDQTAVQLSIIAALLFLPLGLHLPYFPVWLSARGLSDAEIAAALATPMVLRVIATPLIAAFADRRGIGVALAACAVSLFAGYCGLRFATGFGPIFIGALIVAVAMGSLPALADALTLTEIRRAEVSARAPIAYGHIRVWTSIGVLAMMLSSGRIVEAFPGDRIIVALAGLSLFSVGVAVFAALRMNPTHVYAPGEGGRLTADGARLRLAIVGIAAAALIQSSHAEVYSFATIHWRESGLSPDLISAAWAMGVASESILFVIAARYFKSDRSAITFLLIGAGGAVLRWTAMSFDPGPGLVIALQAMHGLSFGATTCGSVLLLGSLASSSHRARMQGWLAAASSLSLAAATFVCGRLTGLFGERAYLAMAALAGAGAAAALLAGWLKQRLPE
ncbi:MFS transporter [Methylocella tundrae]|uniref:MFS transporter n=1 Tax=Methylocella tundrae TaxID=227605 RepID=A0A8B6MBI4_METTU|nr:MFS transporter [Methylocella tundrae]VTZ51438.1 MFS transporter [Methylocella tundrae]